MSAPISKSEMTFALPNLSYVDARWEEPNLVAQDHVAKKPGLFARIAGMFTALSAWNEQRAQAAELRSMSDRELSDIGLNRGDVGRVFSQAHNRDLIMARALTD